ncbi:MarR family transcriptional regulator [Actinotalea sp. M2MS4P-6]|uniref:MarR family winged helix-turn-helix transcriptional regulator n=1 Tax=Actinotalea sp. M2MS4P-6 TaxID=2983762 RepID=UPI0021E44660|nr:MarR family transcriptional regulator [Actinotalea sp. M2MS4P-6]MCV2394323.1 MarR family transcriptional regulator [Actinotalea sp. M2MS4P-6]
MTPPSPGPSALSIRALAEQWARFGKDPDAVELIGLIRAAALRVTDESDELLAEHGLNRGRFDVLAALYRAGVPLTQAELAAQMLVTPAGMKKRLDALVADGLVSRRTDVSDARRQPLSLTAAGSARLEEALDEVFTIEATAVAALGEPGRRRLAELLRTLLAD